jgi:hypothetical protein
MSSFDPDVLSAASVASVLPSLDLSSEWADTGGGVFNLEVSFQDFSGACSDVLAYVGISDNGEWTHGDYATPAVSVSVILYDALTGDPFDTAAWCPDWSSVDDVAYATTVDEAQTLVRMAEAHVYKCFNFESLTFGKDGE